MLSKNKKHLSKQGQFTSSSIKIKRRKHASLTMKKSKTQHISSDKEVNFLGSGNVANDRFDIP